MAPNLPPELIDKTLDELEEKADLASCSLVDHSWQPFAQSKIFRTVTLGAGVGQGYPDGLLDVLGLHVRTLNLGLRPQAVDSHEWPTIERTMAETILQLPNLHHLGLFPCSYLPCALYIAPDLHYSFMRLTFKSLHLSQWCLGDPSALSAFGDILPPNIRFTNCHFDPEFNLGLAQGLAKLFRDPKEASLANPQPVPVAPLLSSPTINLEITNSSSLEIFVRDWVFRHPTLSRHIVKCAFTLCYDGTLVAAHTCVASGLSCDTLVLGGPLRPTAGIGNSRQRVRKS
ncbi:hypothetical protein R3P38DRAFT_2793548 [Favolaschia claudopus]|uniref:Uncharacterized protein n=1 Tax=Favolaschia claudopus TaxID=2862362 RepID=A0AAW0ADA8_9AGAR